MLKAKYHMIDITMNVLKHIFFVPFNLNTACYLLLAEEHNSTEVGDNSLLLISACSAVSPDCLLSYKMTVPISP